jgi:hypothetical protein
MRVITAASDAVMLEPPLKDLLEGRDGHWGGLERGSSALVVAPCPGLMLVAISDEAGELLGVLADDPVLLERPAVRCWGATHSKPRPNGPSSHL